MALPFLYARRYLRAWRARSRLAFASAKSGCAPSARSNMASASFRRPCDARAMPEVVHGLGRRRLRREGGAELAFGVRIPAQFQQHHAEVVAGVAVGRVELGRALQGVERAGRVAGVRQRVAEIAVRPGEGWREAQRLAELRDGLARLAARLQSHRQVGVRLHRIGHPLQRLPVLRHRVPRLALRQRRVGEIEARVRIGRLQAPAAFSYAATASSTRPAARRAVPMLL